MQSLTIDVLNSKAIKLLQDLESLQLIRVRQSHLQENASVNWAASYKGAMTKQPIVEIDRQLNELRNEWE